MVIHRGQQTKEVNQAAESVVAQCLHRDGWQIAWDNRDAAFSYIEARKGTAQLLVRVTSAIAPDAPDLPGSSESIQLRQRATELETVAWIAKVRLDSDLNLNRINWVPL